MTNKTSDIPDELRAPLLAAALPHVPFDGWSDKLLSQAAAELDVDPGIARLAFPDGAIGMIDLMAQQRDQMMVDICTAEKLAALKIRQKITLLVRSRVSAESDLREAARAAVTHLALPGNSVQGVKFLYRTVDLMWKTIHDPSTDFNYYTKRLTLSAVYSTTLLYWFNDESDGYQDTWDFLDRRIENVMQFEKTKAQANKQLKGLTDRMPDLWKGLSRLRYPPA